MKKDILKQKNNSTEISKIKSLLYDLYNTRQKLYHLCAENKLVGYTTILDALSYFEEVVGEVNMAIEYKREALDLLENSELMDKEDRTDIYRKELVILLNREL